MLIPMQGRAGFEITTSGRAVFGSSYRLEAADPVMLNTANAAAAGLVGLTTNGANSDDGNTNFRRGDATSTALKAYLDVNAKNGDLTALLRVKAWYDYALKNQPRAFGNIGNNYVAGEPLSDRGAAPLARFSGVAAGDAWVQQRFAQGLVRIGQQSLNWGERVSFIGGLQGLNPTDFPALHRPGAVPQEIKVPVPMLFGRLEPVKGVAVEGFWQTHFRPEVLDQCGTFYEINDWAQPGCDKVFAGLPAGSDRTRVGTGGYLKRIDDPLPHQRQQYGMAVLWTADSLATDFGLYGARYTSRKSNGVLQKSTRTVGAPLIPGDPDGKNVRYFSEFPDGIEIYGATFAHKRGATTWYGEATYRLHQPIAYGPGDALGAFVSATAASLLRARANAMAPGAYFEAMDRFRVSQAQVGVQHDWQGAGGIAYSGMAEAVVKHVFNLPQQGTLRYGRADQYGLGAIGALCVSTTPTPDKQCSQDGYVSSHSWAYRLRLDARFGEVAPGTTAALSTTFTNDVKGWSGDFFINEGRQTLNVALRFEFQKRYSAEIAFTPVWGGDYNPQHDRDQLAMAVGVKF
ncbi:MAG: DUF1302 family protein [Pseudomonadota bacterium]